MAINKCGDTQRISIYTNQKLKWFITYRDALTNGNSLQIISGNYVFEVPGRSARMWYAE